MSSLAPMHVCTWLDLWGVIMNSMKRVFGK